MKWIKAELSNVDVDAYYLVKTNGEEWRDFDLCILRGYLVARKLDPDYVRGRPVWIAKITIPADD